MNRVNFWCMVYVYGKTINLKYDITRNFYLRWKNRRQMELLLAFYLFNKRIKNKNTSTRNRDDL